MTRDEMRLAGYPELDAADRRLRARPVMRARRALRPFVTETNSAGND